MVTLTLLYSGLFLMLQCWFHQYNIIEEISCFENLSDVAGVVLFNCGFIVSVIVCVHLASLTSTYRLRYPSSSVFSNAFDNVMVQPRFSADMCCVLIRVAMLPAMYLEAAASFLLIMLVDRIGFIVQLICSVFPLLLMYVEQSTRLFGSIH